MFEKRKETSKFFKIFHKDDSSLFTNIYHNVSSKISSGTHIPSSLNINILSPPETKKHDFQNKIFYKIFIKGDRGGCRMAGTGNRILNLIPI